MLKNLTRTNERYVAFGDEVVVGNRVLIGFSKESVWYGGLVPGYTTQRYAGTLYFKVP